MSFDSRVGGSGRKPLSRTDSSESLEEMKTKKTDKSEKTEKSEGSGKSEKTEKRSSKHTDESRYTTGKKGSLESRGSEIDLVSPEEKSRKPEKKKGFRLFSTKKKKPSTKVDTPPPPTQTAPPQDNWWDKPPTACTKSKTEVGNYIDQHLPMTKFQPDQSLSKLENLQTLNSMDSAFLAVARGGLRMNLENALNSGEVTRHSDPVPEKELEFAKGGKFQGACNYVAGEMARFLGGGAIATHLLSLSGGNHSFVHTSDENGGRIIVDPSWRQFKGELGIGGSVEGLPPILVGTPDQIKAYLEETGGSGDRHVAFRNKLVSLYKKG